MTTNEVLNLSAENRNIGKHNSRALRREMRVPGVVYGPKIGNLNVSLLEKEVVKYLKHKYDNAIFTLTSGDKSLNDLKVLKKEVSIHPVTRRPTHIDLFALDLTQTVRIEVEVRFDGKAEGVKEGGVLNVVHRYVEVECLPTSIPEFISIDVTPMGVGDSLHVSDLVVGEGIEILTLPGETLCTVAIVEEEKAAPVAAAAPAEGAAAPAAGAAAPAAADAAKKEEPKK